MAIATSTALMIGSLAATAGGSVMSFAQASKQRKLQEEAERKAEKSMKEARAKLEVNYMEALGIAKEPYELETTQMRAAGAQATAAAAEGEQRGVGATAGRVMAAEQQGQAGIRSEMAKDIYELETATAKESSRLRDEDVKLDLAEAEGAQAAAAQAENFRNQAINQGVQGALSTVQQGLAFIPLYQQNIAAQKAAVSGMNFSTEEFQKFGNVDDGGMGAAGTDGFTNMDFDKIGQMSNLEFRRFKRALSPEQRAMLFNNPQYLQNYQDPQSAFFGFTGYQTPTTKP